MVLLQHLDLFLVRLDKWMEVKQSPDKNGSTNCQFSTVTVLINISIKAELSCLPLHPLARFSIRLPLLSSIAWLLLSRLRSLYFLPSSVCRLTFRGQRKTSLAVFTGQYLLWLSAWLKSPLCVRRGYWWRCSLLCSTSHPALLCLPWVSPYLPAHLLRTEYLKSFFFFNVSSLCFTRVLKI